MAELLEVFVFKFADLIDPSFVTSALEICGEKSLYDFCGIVFSHKTSGQREDISIIVLTRKACDLRAPCDSSAYAFYFVCGDRHSGPRTANENALIIFAGRDTLCDLLCIIGIIDAFSRSRAQIDVFDTEFIKGLFDLFLFLKTRVVCGQSNFLCHNVNLSL